MTDKEFVHTFLNKNYKIGSNDTQLCCYCIITKKTYDFGALWFELKDQLLGNFVTFDILNEWYEAELLKKRTLIINNLVRIDLKQGSFIASHEFAIKLRDTGLTKKYLDTIFKPYYIEHQLKNSHKELFKEFRLQLGKNNWDVFWENEKIGGKHIRELFKGETLEVMSHILGDFDTWYQQAINEECERQINNSYK